VTRASGILLAGGASRRFGRNKLLEPLAGRPLYERPLSALGRTCDEVVVVLGPDSPDLAVPSDVARVRFVRDDATHEGPLAGCARGLREVTADVAILAAGDMPGLSTGVLALLRSELTADVDAVVLADGGSWRPLPAALAATRARPVTDKLLARGERRLRALFEEVSPKVVAEATWAAVDPEGDWRWDVDEPTDLVRERRRGGV
jgi:molybdopterin-guanine dinucleotide biosynthesis protein A